MNKAKLVNFAEQVFCRDACKAANFRNIGK